MYQQQKYSVGVEIRVAPSALLTKSIGGRELPEERAYQESVFEFPPDGAHSTVNLEMFFFY